MSVLPSVYKQTGVAFLDKTPDYVSWNLQPGTLGRESNMRKMEQGFSWGCVNSNDSCYFHLLTLSIHGVEKVQSGLGEVIFI